MGEKLKLLCRATTAAIPLMLVLTGTATAQPPGRMMMDDEQRQHMMGFGFGPMMGGTRGYGMMNMMGPGMGMMGMGPMMGPLSFLDLTAEQRRQMRQLQRELRDQHMKLMDKMWDDSDKIEEIWSKDRVDPKEAGKAYERVFNLQREMIEQRATYHNRVMDLLTEQQRKKLKEYGPGWMME
jgi:Spy/CpxP family protein refolding chaperone